MSDEYYSLYTLRLFYWSPRNYFHSGRTVLIPIVFRSCSLPKKLTVFPLSLPLYLRQRYVYIVCNMVSLSFIHNTCKLNCWLVQADRDLGVQPIILRMVRRLLWSTKVLKIPLLAGVHTLPNARPSFLRD